MNVLANVTEELTVIENVEATLGEFLNLTLADGTVLRFDAIGEDEFTIEVSEEMMAEIQNKMEVVSMNKQEIFEKAMELAREVIGVDPAYFGEEGTEEVERQLNKMGYTLDDLREDCE